VDLFDIALDQWERGEARLALAPPLERPLLERVTRAIETELRRRLGGAFTAAELVALYDQGTDWCANLAIELAPDDPYAWDQRIVADAAFARYLRSATDFAGGRRVQSQ